MTKEAEKLKTEEVIREAPLERGETLIMDYTVCLLYTSPSPRD